VQKDVTRPRRAEPRDVDRQRLSARAGGGETDRMQRRPGASRGFTKARSRGRVVGGEEGFGIQDWGQNSEAEVSAAARQICAFRAYHADEKTREVAATPSFWRRRESVLIRKHYDMDSGSLRAARGPE
jgi:hypothetical protein